MEQERIKTYWCLGSNINAEQNIRFAVRSFQRDFNDVVVSNLYKSPAQGFVGDDFLNTALLVETDNRLSQLLDYADGLEKEAGRVRIERGRFDSRTLDVDLLMYGDLIGEHQSKKWPSNDMDENAFVLKPLSEIAPQERHPVSKQTFASLWNAFTQGDAGITQVEKVW